MTARCAAVVSIAPLLFSACGSSVNSSADPGLASEIRMIRAIDNHAHPVRVVGPGEPPDRGFDALPVDNMEPQTDPVNLRPNAPAILDAWNALYGLKVGDQTAKQKFAARKEQRYPAWVLDQMGVEVMLANRVEMGSSIQPPRFRWVPYADALLFPLDNAELAARNSDRKSFFALEDVLRRRYLEQNKLERPPATLAGYLARVVTPTLEAQKQGGAVAEKFEAAYLRSRERRRPRRRNTSRFRTSCSAISPPNAAGWGWPCICTPWPAPADTLRWRERIHCCSKASSTTRSCARRAS
jgi:hypothetical protein